MMAKMTTRHAAPIPSYYADLDGPEIEVTDGGAYLRVAGWELDLSSPDANNDETTLGNLRDLKAMLLALQTAITAEMPEVDEAIADVNHCDTCRGAGVLEVPEDAYPRSMRGLDYECRDCGGTGKGQE